MRFFQINADKRRRNRRILQVISHSEGGYILADRGYSTSAGIQHVEKFGGYLTVRGNTGALHFEEKSAKPFDLLSSVESIKQAGKTEVWTAYIKTSSLPIQGRICAIRKTDEAIEEADHEDCTT